MASRLIEGDRLRDPVLERACRSWRGHSTWSAAIRKGCAVTARGDGRVRFDGAATT